MMMVIEKNTNIGNELGCQCDYHFLKCIDILKEYISGINIESVASIGEFHKFMAEIECKRKIFLHKDSDNSLYKLFGKYYGKDNVYNLPKLCSKIKGDDFDNFLKLIEVVNSSTVSILDICPYKQTFGFDIKFEDSISGILSDDCEKELISLFRNCYFAKILNNIKNGNKIKKISIDSINDDFRSLLKELKYHLLGNEKYEFEIGFSFKTGKLVHFDEESSKKQSTFYIGNLFLNQGDGDDIDLNKEVKRYVICGKDTQFELYKLFTKKVTFMLKKLAANIIDFEWPGYIIENIYERKVPLCLFTDKQLKSILEKEKDRASVALVPFIRNWEPEDQFDRFIKILSQI